MGSSALSQRIGHNRVTRLGIIVALAAETRSLAPLRRKGAQTAWGGYTVLLGGAGPANARAAAANLIGQGAEALLSWGCCAALTPEIQPGHVIVPQAVVGDTGPCTLHVDWQQHLYTKLASRLAVNPGPLAQSDTIIANAADKVALAARTGAVAVDMESAAVAAVAREHGLPCAVLRAVADPADQTLPAIVLNHTDADGVTHIPGLLGALLRAPGQLPDLLALGRQFAAALASLDQAARLLQQNFLPSRLH